MHISLQLSSLDSIAKHWVMCQLPFNTNFEPLWLNSTEKITCQALLCLLMLNISLIMGWFFRAHNSSSDRVVSADQTFCIHIYIIFLKETSLLSSEESPDNKTVLKKSPKYSNSNPIPLTQGNHIFLKAKFKHNNRGLTYYCAPS